MVKTTAEQYNVNVTIVGVDCATDAKKIGVALATVIGPDTTLLDVKCNFSACTQIIDTVCDWIRGADRVLLAFDSPLGWPAALGKALVHHEAGDKLDVEPNELFRRKTDRIVQKVVGKRPLDIGADRIARTAYWALTILDKLRKRMRHPIPLLLQTKVSERISVIEVYPAGTLEAHRQKSLNYKRPGQRTRREEVVNFIEATMHGLSDHLRALLLENANALDAVLCILAAIDFLAGDVIEISPEDYELAKKEGWIWVAKPKTELPHDPSRSHVGNDQGRAH